MITISIVSHGQKDLVANLLNDFTRVGLPQVSRIVLTHNFTDDRSSFPSVLNSIPINQIYNDVPKGFGANHNAAFAVCNTPYFAVLNPDLKFESDPFGLLLAKLVDSGHGLIAPRILNVDGSQANSARSLYTPLESFRGLLGLSKVKLPPDWMAGMFLLFRSSVFRSLKGFDEKYFMYVEDVDICARVQLSGTSLCFLADVCVIHDARRANRKSIRHLTWHLTSALRWWTSRTFWTLLCRR
jgi:N-acetylglucosaminyl-diphospho-decaprenol L-rhamnosyltransferase